MNELITILEESLTREKELTGKYANQVNKNEILERINQKYKSVFNTLKDDLILIKDSPVGSYAKEIRLNAIIEKTINRLEDL